MKKLLLILLCLPLLFTTCKKEELNNNGQVNTTKVIGYGISDSEVFKTTDGGENWTKTAYKSFAKLDVISEDIVYGIHNNYFLEKTIDGGSNWGLYESLYFIKDIDFISEDIGFSIQTNQSIGGWIMDSINGVIYVGDIIFKTSNGGANWDFLSPLFDVDGVYLDNLEDICFISENIGFCTDNLGSLGHIIYKTIDGGLTWNAVDEIPNYVEFNFISEDIGYYNDNTYIYKTTDSGLTWGVIDQIRFNDFDFISDGVGFGSGMNSSGIWKTIDGGLTWNTVSTMNFNPITFTKEVNGN